MSTIQTVSPAISTAALADILHAADQALGSNPGAARLLLAHATALLSPPVAAPSGCLAPWQQRKVKAHIEANLHLPLRVRDLAALVRLSASYFARAFKGSFGETPHAYLQRLRMQRAQALMLQGNDPLAHIALDCGMADPAHLSRVFRRSTGFSPAAWRRHHIGAPVVGA